MKIVLIGCLCETLTHKGQILDGFKKEFGGKFDVLGVFKTLPGHGGPGGRSDVVVEMPDEVIGKAAVHPWHLSGKFSWWDDYLVNNQEIIPNEAKLKFFTDGDVKVKVSGETSQGVEESQRPTVKLVGEDGNVFNIIGRVSKALKRAGLPEKAKEFANRATSSHSYDTVIALCFEYVDVE